MPGTRLTSGVTLDLVHQRLALAVQEAGIVDASQVLLVLDDEVIPKDLPPAQQFVTVRLPSASQWSDGDVFGGGGNVGEFIVLGQTRVTYWTSNDLDLYGQAGTAMAEAAGAGPRGSQALGRL